MIRKGVSLSNGKEKDNDQYEQIKSYYITEYEDWLPNILKVTEFNFMAVVRERVQAALNDKFKETEMISYKFKNMLKEIEGFIIKNYYKKDNLILSKAWNEYEINLIALNKSNRLSSKNIESFSYMKDFRKHCKKTEDIALHSCGGKFIEVGNEDNKVTHVICINCKDCYYSKCMLLYCSTCNQQYYASMIDTSKEDVPFATWENYHCGAMINDKMRCIKCRNFFCYDNSKNILYCSSCNFKSDPLSIAWSCIICKNEFKCGAKVYNPLEFKLIKNAIKESLLIKQKAHPLNVPCCKLNVYSTDFFHKKDCSGKLFSGELNKQVIVVCESCKSMNFYDKYVWTCPNCKKRFRMKTRDENNLTNSSMLSSNYQSPLKINSTPSTNIEKSFNLDLQPMTSSDSSSNNTKDDFYRSAKENREVLAKKNNNISMLDQDFRSLDLSKVDISQNNVKRVQKRKTLIDIMEERKVIDSMKKNQTPIIVSKSKTLIDEDVLSQSSSNLMSKFSESKPSFVLNAKDKNPKSNLGKVSPYEEEEKLKPINNKDESSNNNNKSNLLKNIKQIPIKLNSSSISKDSVFEENNVTEKSQNNKPTFSNSSRYNLKNNKPLEIFNYDEYKILSQIGEGSYGKIYLVENKNKKTFAMKKLIAHDEEDLKNLTAEFNLVNTYRHPNIMEIYGYNQKKLDSTTWVLYILMEVARTDWDKEIRHRVLLRKYYTEVELVNILKQIVSGLSYLQYHKVSHRDIKPQNVLQFAGDIYKVADFGEAKEVKVSKQLNTLRGTELYMSPILFASLRKEVEDVTHNPYKSDVFSLGFCMLYATTLSYNVINEFRELTSMTDVSKLLEKYLSVNYSYDLIYIIEKMIHLNESQRFDFLDLQEALKKTFKLS